MTHVSQRQKGSTLVEAGVEVMEAVHALIVAVDVRIPAKAVAEIRAVGAVADHHAKVVVKEPVIHHVWEHAIQLVTQLAMLLVWVVLVLAWVVAQEHACIRASIRALQVVSD